MRTRKEEGGRRKGGKGKREREKENDNNDE